MLNPLPDLNPAFQGLFADAQADHTAAQGRADALWAQMQEQMQAPQQQMDPQRQFLATLMGGLSQALAPQMGGQQQAQEGIAGVNADLRNRRTMSLQALHDRYTEAAAQAEQAGDSERAIKMRNAELKVNKELADIARTQSLTDAKTKQGYDMAQLHAQGQNALAVAGVQGQTARDVAGIGYDKAIDVENAKLAVERAKMRIDAKGQPLPTYVDTKALMGDVAKLVASKREAGAEAGEIRNAVAALWTARTTADRPGNAGMMEYGRRLGKAPVEGGKVVGIFGDGRLYKDSEIASAIGSNYLATLGRERAPEDYLAMQRALLAAGLDFNAARLATLEYAQYVLQESPQLVGAAQALIENQPRKAK